MVWYAAKIHQIIVAIGRAAQTRKRNVATIV